MFRSEAVLIDSFKVSFSAVADVFIKAVMWIFFGEFKHIVITSDFSDYGGGRNGGDFCITFDAGSGEFF